VPRRVGGEHGLASIGVVARFFMSTQAHLLPFQPMTMSPAQLAAVSFLARYAGHTHELYTYQLRRWFQWCEVNELDPLMRIQRAHVELYIRSLGDAGLMASSINTMMHGVRGFFRFATSTERSRPTPPSTPGYPRCTATSPEPKASTGSS
jgi:site-specific recombinase XerD